MPLAFLYKDNDMSYNSFKQEKNMPIRNKVTSNCPLPVEPTIADLQQGELFRYASSPGVYMMSTDDRNGTKCVVYFETGRVYYGFNPQSKVTRLSHVTIDQDGTKD